MYIGKRKKRGGKIMPDYEKLYHKTFNAITDVERLLEQAKTILQTIQQECEDIYAETDDKQAETTITVKVCTDKD